MPLLLGGSGPNAGTLREQYASSWIENVDVTRTGFYIDFALPPDAPVADPEAVHGGPSAEAVLTSPRLGDAGAILWFNRGRISSLELYACDPWPPHLAVEIGIVTSFPG
ncbi:MAG: hypothetical protein AAF845_14095 [Bacteroidota bacterium]